MTTTHRFAFDRRRLLRGMLGGATVSIALPRLEAMLNNHGTAYAAGEPLPLRYGQWGWGHGMHPELWVPPNVGANYTLPEELQPLAPVREYMTIVSGLTIKIDFPHGGHTWEGALLTGAPPFGKKDDDVTVSRPTIDQVIAGQLGKNTPLRSLEVAVDGTHNVSGGTVWHHWSHNGPNSPNPCSYSAAAVFSRLFGAGTSAAAMKLRKSVLDSVLTDARQMQSALGVGDRARIDQHMDGIRTIEARIDAIASAAPPSASCKKPGAPDPNVVGRSEDYDIRGKLVNKTMSELVAMALACDLTRVFTFQQTEPASALRVASLGVSDWHGVTHNSNEWKSAKAYNVVKLIMSELNVFMSTLKATPEGSGNLLDSCAILASSDVCQGYTHGFDNFPLMVFGRAGGLKSGIHYKGNPALENATIVPYTLSMAVGANLGSFGVGRGLVTKPLSAIYGA